MKKIISILLCVVLVVSAMFSLSVTASAIVVEPTAEFMISTDEKPHTIEVSCSFFASYANKLYLLGDCDHNEKVNVLDATYLQRCIADITSMDLSKLLCADSNFDKEADIVDVTNIQRYIAGLEIQNCYCGDYFGVIDFTPVMPTTPAVKEDYLYFTNTYRWDTVYAYYWEEPEIELITWPGEEMEFVKVNGYGYKIYRFVPPENADMVVFNCGQGGVNYQTSAIPIEGMNMIYSFDGWYEYNEYY